MRDCRCCNHSGNFGDNECWCKYLDTSVDFEECADDCEEYTPMTDEDEYDR